MSDFGDVTQGDIDRVPYRFFYGPTNNRYLDRYDQAVDYRQDLIEQWGAVLDKVYSDLDEIIAQAASPDFYPDQPAAPGAPRPPVLAPEPDLPNLWQDIPQATPYPTVGDYTLPVTTPIGPLILPDDPTLLGVSGVSPLMPAAPVLPPIDTNIAVPDIPEFNPQTVLTQPPPVKDVVIPLAPVPSPTPPIDTTPPDNIQHIDTIPPAPNIVIDPIDDSLYEVPDLVLSPVNIPTLPPYVIPGLPEPGEFLSCVSAALCDSLNDMLTKAQLDADYDTVSWESAMAREAEAARTALMDVTAIWGARGFAFPPGQMAAMDVNVRRGIEIRGKEASRELYTRRREQELAVRTTALTAATQKYAADAQVYTLIERLALEQLQFIESQALRAYELALRAADLEAAKRDAELSEFNAHLEGQKAQWDAETQKTQQKLANASLYTAQIGGIEAQASVAATEMGAYRAHVDAQATAAKAVLDRDQLLFATWSRQVDVVLEEIKTQSVYADIIRAQASAMTAEATAYSADIGGRVSQVEAQATAIEAEASGQKAVVDLYSSQVSAEKVRTDTLLGSEQIKQSLNRELLTYLTSKSQALADHSKAESDMRSAEVSADSGAYQARVSSIGSVAIAQMGMFNALASRTNALAAAQGPTIALYRATLDSTISVYRAQAQADSDSYRQALSAWTASVQQKTAAYDMMITKLGFVGNYPSEIIRSALGAQIVSLSTGEDFNYNQNLQYQATLTNSKTEAQTTHINISGD